MSGLQPYDHAAMTQEMRAKNAGRTPSDGIASVALGAVAGGLVGVFLWFVRDDREEIIRSMVGVPEGRAVPAVLFPFYLGYWWAVAIAVAVIIAIVVRALLSLIDLQADIRDLHDREFGVDDA